MQIKGPMAPPAWLTRGLGPLHTGLCKCDRAPAPLGYANKASCGPAPTSITESARSGKSGGPDFISVSACLTSDLSDCSTAPGPCRGSEGSGGGGLDRASMEPWMHSTHLHLPGPQFPHPCNGDECSCLAGLTEWL